MQNKGYYRRLSLFKKFSINFDLVKIHTNAFKQGQLLNEIKILCPICLKGYGEEGLQQSFEDSLTEEHVIPKKFGGKQRILTCKICNNNSGGRIDSMLAKEANVTSFLKGDTDVRINGKLSIKGIGYPQPVFVKRLSNEVLSFELKEMKYFQTIQEGNELDLKFESPIVKANIAQLKIAFLLAFEKFGYGFVFNPGYEPIRQQILNPNKTILKSFGCLVPPKGIEEGIYFNMPKDGMKALIVVFNLKLNGRDDFRSVFLPPPNCDCVKFYDDFLQIRKIKKIVVKDFPAPNLNYLNTHPYCLFPSVWKSIETAMNKNEN